MIVGLTVGIQVPLARAELGFWEAAFPLERSDMGVDQEMAQTGIAAAEVAGPFIALGASAVNVRAMSDELLKVQRDLAAKAATAPGQNPVPALYRYSFQAHLKRIRQGRNLSAEERAALRRFSIMPKWAAVLGGTILFDGGSRALALVNGRDPGILPALNVTWTGVKRLGDAVGGAGAVTLEANPAEAGR